MHERTEILSDISGIGIAMLYVNRTNFGISDVSQHKKRKEHFSCLYLQEKYLDHPTHQSNLSKFPFTYQLSELISKMDDRDHQLQSLSIFHMFYNFMKRLATYALKIMMSGSKTARLPRGTPTPPQEAAMGVEFEPAEQTITCEEEENVSDTSSADLPPHVEEKRRLEPETSFSADANQARVPQKMVSINENVETIKIGKKRSRKWEPEEVDESKPLKSILKVGSDLNNDSGMLINEASNA
ncbi:hypothetical protein EZV62_006911 [Acer yangbiense]|uniref:Uncharacterized protein n=1 Tax=Acer yangbiense TaxID=1000413 RepID=A0A5C7IB60_9ROSI|nr:hypothetical protein EZV62_006911 [Acer yangbiense]